MTDLRVLQEAREHRAYREARRRRERRIHRAKQAWLTAALSLAALLIVFAPGMSDHAGQPTASGRAAQTPGGGRANATARPARQTYGHIPSAVTINPRLRLKLRSGLLFDVRTGKVIWSRSPDEQLPIASLTKMMTALVVVAHSKPTDRVLITRDAVHFTGSGVGMLPKGKRVSEKALLYGLLLPSGNDAAIALAEHVARTQGRFIAIMNAKAHALGLVCTHFSTVSGVIDAHNQSCASDLAVLAHAVVRQRVLAPIVAARSAILRFPIKGGKLFLYNNNPLLRNRYPGTDGVKTGYTVAAGLCIVATARRGHRWLGVVLLHSADWNAQATTLLNDGFAAIRSR